ncbi:Transposase IS200 like protein [Clostridium luticellarii]|jgi:putative transposase|uniref:Transposase IS200 like protein n=1 Tax=Clostridium luticellarii TaxID=1691940 RepID=A0A2T0BS37_9CLOT|nr:Transposase IS200 like protein [Clostridium luticellarii]
MIKYQIWEGYFWSKSYCLITTGGAPIDIVKEYIENQGMK